MIKTSNDARRSVWPARGLSAVIDFACGSHKRAAALLVAVALLAFIPGFFQIPAVDRDEARFAQATKQMIESGDYVDIRFHDVARYKKPVGIYWLQAAAVKTAGFLGVNEAHTTISLYRLPSLAGAIGAVLLTYWAALAFVGRRAAMLAALMLACSILLGVEARLAKTDAMLLFTTVAAMGAMARVYLVRQRIPEAAAGWSMPAIFWTALAGGVLLKGPPIIMVVGLAAIALAIGDRSARWMMALRPLAGFACLVVLTLPWFVAIAIQSDGRFFVESLGRDVFPKVLSGQEAHGAPPGYYFLLFWVTFWPGAVLAGIAAPMIWKSRREPGARFLLAWLVPSWLVFELVVTKLPHYVLPLYPAAAILIAGMVDQGGLTRSPWLMRGTSGWFIVPALIAIVGIGLFMVVGRNPGFIAWPTAAAAVIFGLFAWWLYEADGAERALLRAGVSSLLIAFTVYGVIFAMSHALFPSVQLARELRASGCDRPQVAAAGYHEPSVVYYLGTATRLTDGAGAAEFLGQGACRFAIVESRSARHFAQRADAIGLRYSLGARIEGINISKGRAITLTIYRSESEQ